MEGEDKRSSGQHGAHDFTLHSDSPPVDDAECFQAQPVGLLEIRLNDFFDFLRPHSVQVKDVSDGNAQWFVVVFHFALPLRPLARTPGFGVRGSFLGPWTSRGLQNRGSALPGLAEG